MKIGLNSLRKQLFLQPDLQLQCVIKKQKVRHLHQRLLTVYSCRKGETRKGLLGNGECIISVAGPKCRAGGKKR